MSEESAWPEIQALVVASPVPVHVLPVDTGRGEPCRAELGVGTGSRLGAVVTHSGGVSVDHGWLRVLGSGTRRLPDVVTATRETGGSVVVAFDVLGGRFDWFPADPGASPTVHYFAPDELAWIDLDMGYGAWLEAVLYPPPWTTEGKDS